MDDERKGEDDAPETGSERPEEAPDGETGSDADDPIDVEAVAEAIGAEAERRYREELEREGRVDEARCLADAVDAVRCAFPEESRLSVLRKAEESARSELDFTRFVAGLGPRWWEVSGGRRPELLDLWRLVRDLETNDPVALGEADLDSKVVSLVRKIDRGEFTAFRARPQSPDGVTEGEVWCALVLARGAPHEGGRESLSESLARLVERAAVEVTFTNHGQCYRPVDRMKVGEANDATAGPEAPPTNSNVARRGAAGTDTARPPLTDRGEQILVYLRKIAPRGAYSQEIATQIKSDASAVRRLLSKNTPLRMYYGVQRRDGKGYFVQE